MQDDLYKLAGTVSIPSEKREEFNKNVIALLNGGGIRKTRGIKVGGRDITVVVPVCPDNKGIASFNYSIYEKKVREASTFNTITGELAISERGYSEYGVIVNSVMILQQAYSVTPCFLTYKGKPCAIENYIVFIEGVLGKRISVQNGRDIWGVYVFFHKCPDYDDVDALDVYHTCYHESINVNQIRMALSLSEREIKLTDEVQVMDRIDIRTAKYYQKIERMYRLFRSLSSEEKLESWIRDLIESDISKRRSMSEDDSDYGEIAELSLKIYSQVVVKVYSMSRDEDFWDIWERLGGSGYQDIEIEKESETNEQETNRELPLYKVIMRDYEDEMIELWDKEDLKMSDTLRNQIEVWKTQYGDVSVPDGFDTEKVLGDILVELREVWDCRLPDKSFVEEFLDNKKNTKLQKLLQVLWNMMNEGVQDFPELTRSQAVSWILNRIRDKYDSILMSAYVSLMTNNQKRKEIFGV